ncbi:MAG: ABC transporter permease [Gemmatimonadaceae bacterium]|nr:ABC transporter permease [Gemmatimonadaceae bacterium]
MTWRELVGRLAAWRRRDTLARELDADLQAHLDLLARDHEAAGLSSVEARQAARRQLGNLTTLREESRSYWGFPLVEAVWRDLRYAARGLIRSPGFTLTAVLTIGLGIGANAAMFSVIDQLMFRPFPYLRDAGTVRRVYTQTDYQERRNTNHRFPYTRYLDLTANVPAIADAAAMSEHSVAVGTGDASRLRSIAAVSASFFRFFDAPPAMGRYFTADEDHTPVGEFVAVLTFATWQNDFGGDLSIVGKTLKIGAHQHVIIGVAPPNFVGAAPGRAPDIFVPITSVPINIERSNADTYWTDYNWDWTEVLVRLKAGVDETSANAALTTALLRSRANARALNPRVLPDSLVHPRVVLGAIKSAAGPEPSAEAKVLLWVMGVAAIVLAIACASVANLQLARVMRRRHELTLRLALGVSPAQLSAQLLTENLLLACLACVAGLAVAQWTGTAIRALLLGDAKALSLTDDLRTLSLAVGCAVVSTLLVSAGPLLLARRTDLVTMLKGGVRDGGARRSTLQAALLAMQVAFSVVLLVGAGLFVRSFAKVRAVPLGFDVRPVIEVTANLRGQDMSADQRIALRNRLLGAAQALPGVEAVTAVNSRLFGTNTGWLQVPGIDSVAALGRFSFQVTTPSYFDVMRTPIVRGRGFDDSDRLGTPRVAVVSSSMADVLWPHENPLGKCLQVAFGPQPPATYGECTTVIGVAQNSAQVNIADDPRFMYYMPVAQQEGWALLTLLVRGKGRNVNAMIEPVRRALTAAMPGDGLVVVRPLQELVDAQMRSWRVGAMLFLAFGGLAFVVAIIGLYGVISDGVAGRRHELGVRVALGASTYDVIRLVVADGVRLAVIGSTIGVVIAFGAARWVQPLLFGQSATDLRVYAAVALLMLLVAIIASLLPARRAALVDPTQALRAE